VSRSGSDALEKDHAPRYYYFQSVAPRIRTCSGDCDVSVPVYRTLTTVASVLATAGFLLKLLIDNPACGAIARLYRSQIEASLYSVTLSEAKVSESYRRTLPKKAMQLDGKVFLFDLFSLLKSTI